jgi:hypothetical protein
MTELLTPSRTRSKLLLVALLMIAVAALPTRRAVAAEATEDRLDAADPQAVPDASRSERVIVDPEPEWNGWLGPNDGWNPGGPRVDIWVDRGDWATYRPGDRLLAFFRVDRPCYVTILDYAPDGRVDVLFPNRWSGSNFVRPGRTYRMPESRRYSLRIAGPGGVETLVACAHEVPWPSGPDGYWIPPYPPRHGRVVAGRPGGQMRPPGRHGRVIVGPQPPHPWPVPNTWIGQRNRWGCDSVSLRVVTGSLWMEADEQWRGDGRGGPYTLLDDSFTMSRCSDSYYRDLYVQKDPLTVNIECVESRDGDPTEIVGRLVWHDGWGSETVFRVDVEGKNGERPRDDRLFVERVGDLIVEIRIEDFELGKVKPWQLPRIEWIRFSVRISGDRLR